MNTLKLTAACLSILLSTLSYSYEVERLLNFSLTNDIQNTDKKIRFADDRDFTNYYTVRRYIQFQDTKLTPDEVKINDLPNSKPITVLIFDHGKFKEIEGLLFKTNKNQFHRSRYGTMTCNYTTVFSNNYYAIKNGSRPYEINFQGDCNAPLVITFKPENPATHVLSIWRIAYLAGSKLKATVGLDFWNERIDFLWPEDSDYYSFGSVHISDGTHWDVVGHEMGHAIYDIAQIGDFGGGSHKIDQCYSDALAISEGWATYFSAWVSLNPNDPDAKFEYMVPRRAPIQIENVPSDVCRGVRSEWRVSSFFWDLYDLNDDIEQAKINFALTWKSLYKKNIHNMQDAYVELHNNGKLSKEIIKEVADHNF